MTRLGAMLLAVATVAACSSVGTDTVAGSRTPTPGTGTVEGSLQPTDPVDRASYHGIGIAGTGTDRYGTYPHMWVLDPSRVVDLDDVIVAPAALDQYGKDELTLYARWALNFFVGVVIDSPLVFDDSAAAQEDFWASADGYLLETGPFRDYFESRQDVGDFALVDDDRGEWRQAAGYRPTPYRSDRARARINELTLTRVGYSTDYMPGPTFEFQAVYSRPVVDSSGGQMWERVATRYTITGGFRADGQPRITALQFNGHSPVGIYLEGGWKGLPQVERTALWTGAVVQDGRGVTFPVFDGWSTASDMEEATQRGIRLEHPDLPDAVPAYYRGAVAGVDDAPYLVTRVEPPDNDPYLSDLEDAMAQADLPEEQFWAVGAQGGRLSMRGARYATVDLRTADADAQFDVISVDVMDVLGWRHQADYFVEQGTGEQRLEDVINGLRLDPVAMARAAVSAWVDVDNAQ